MAVHPRVVGMRDQLAEALSQQLLAFDGDVLVAEEERPVVHEAIVQNGELGVRQIAEVDPVDVGADYGGHRREGDGVSTHGGNPVSTTV